jgi:uncharacterized membrane protein
MDIVFYLSWLIVVLAVALIIMLKPLQLKKTVYPIYFLFLLLVFFCYLYTLAGSKFVIINFIGTLLPFITLSLVIIHSSLTLGKKKTSIFFISAFIFALISESIGVKYGLIFGHYYYNPLLAPFFFGLVPIMIVVSWLPFIYISYTFANMILKGFGSQKPNIKQNKLFMIVLLFLLSAISGLVAVNLDMLLDPVVVSTQGWFWIGGGPYFGVPISNFVGWFLVTFVFTFIFRLYESFKKVNDRSLPKVSLFMSSSIIILYLIYFIIYGFIAFLMGNQVYILIGATTMGPFIIITTLITVIDFLGKNKKK